MRDEPDMLGARYVEILADPLRCLLLSQGGAIGRAAYMMAESLMHGGVVHAFGAGHSHLPAGQLYPKCGKVQAHEVRAGDVMLIFSHSGVNGLAVQIALASKGEGLSVVGLTSVQHAASQPSRHSTRRRLHDVAEVPRNGCGELCRGIVR